MSKAISIARTIPGLAEQAAINLNYLAVMYLECNALEEAETAICESIELSKPHFPGLLADNLKCLAEIQRRNGKHRDALASAKAARDLDKQQDDDYGVARAEELIQRIKDHIA
jgi:hypothetical protein